MWARRAAAASSNMLLLLAHLRCKIEAINSSATPQNHPFITQYVPRNTTSVSRDAQTKTHLLLTAGYPAPG
jgi:hypothetical protein